MTYANPEGLHTVSIASLASAPVGTPGGAAQPLQGTDRASVETDRRNERGEAAQRGRRAPLMDAMMQATGLQARAGADTPVEGAARVADALQSDTPGGGEAIARFAHALMDDLRTLGEGAAHPAWGDLGNQLGALAVQAASGSGGHGADAAVAEVPPQPNPITPTSAAVHLMQVPSSRLLEAYAALRQALPDQAVPVGSAAGEAGGDRAQLAAFLDRLSQSLQPQADAASAGVGNLLDLRA